jgi:hypothetical protein
MVVEGETRQYAQGLLIKYENGHWPLFSCDFHTFDFTFMVFSAPV